MAKNFDFGFDDRETEQNRVQNFEN